MTKKSTRRRRSCRELARFRAQQARRKGMNPVLVALVFVMALLSMPSIFPTPAPAPRRPRPSGENWPVTEYERGPSWPQRRSPRRLDRYGARPPMRRLMRDLRRPAARADAERVLLARVPDADLRSWVSEHVRKDRINRLSIFARPGIPEEAVIAAWRSELNAEQAAKQEAVDEAREQAHVVRALAALAGSNPPQARVTRKV